MSYPAPHQSPLEPLGASARARCARRAGAGEARGVRLPPAHARIPRGARDPRVRAFTAPPARSSRCAGRLTPKPLRHNHECEVHAGRVRGSRTACDCRPRSRGSLAGKQTWRSAHAWCAPGAQLYMATWTTVGLFLIPILILIVFNIIYLNKIYNIKKSLFCIS